MFVRRLGMEPLEDRRMLATFTVSNLLDGPVTAAGQLPGSLRQAIFDANAAAGTDQVAFSSTTGTIALTAGEFQITDALTVTGPGQSSLTIDAQQQSRIFNIDKPGTTTENFAVTIRGLTLTKGSPSGPTPTAAANQDGGAIRSLSLGTLTVEQSLLNQNRALGMDSGGGAIFSQGAVVITDSTISGNTAAWNGGGVYTLGAPVTLTRTTIDDNTSTDTRSRGGGVFANGILTVTDSTISNNQSHATGGGVHIHGPSATIVNSTISGNTVTSGAGLGGGVFAIGALTLRSSTVTGNAAIRASAGGIYAIRAVMLDHSIIAGNSAEDLFPDLKLDPNNNSVTANHSLLGNTSDLTAEQLSRINAGTGNLINVNAQLGSLVNNGGPTKTHALLANSPARNAGGAAVAGSGNVPLYDQRGSSFTRVAGGRIDIGAFEDQSSVAPSGDFDGDGDVDGRDFLAWQRNPSVGSLTAWQNEYGAVEQMSALRAGASSDPTDIESENPFLWMSALSLSETAGEVAAFIDESQPLAVDVDEVFAQLDLAPRNFVRDAADIAASRIHRTEFSAVSFDFAEEPLAS